MEKDFSQEFLKAVFSDIREFSVEFPILVISGSIVFIIVTIIFSRKKEKNLSDMIKEEQERDIKEALKLSKKESLYSTPVVDISMLLGVSHYLYENIDFLFDDIVGTNSSFLFDDDEKKLRKKLRKNNDALSNEFKKNIVYIYLKLEKNENIVISFFHLFYFLKMFPFDIDVNLKGSFILNTSNLNVDLIVESFENEENKFYFDEYFFWFVNLINSHELEISKYLKIKEIFSKSISNFESTIEMKKKQVVLLEVEKVNETKDKEVFYNYRNIKTEEKNKSNGDTKKDIILAKNEQKKIAEKLLNIDNDIPKKSSKVNDSKSLEQEVSVDDVKQDLIDSLSVDKKSKKSSKVNDSKSVEQEVVDDIDFTISKSLNSRKKSFNPFVDLKGIFRTIHKDNIHKDIPLVFIEEDRLYVSSEYLFLKIVSKFSLDNFGGNEFSNKFFFSLKNKIRILNKKDLESKTLRISISSSEYANIFFIVFNYSSFSKFIDVDFLKKISERKNTFLKDIDGLNDVSMIKYLINKGCCK